MEKKDTLKILEELNLCPDFRNFYDENKEYITNTGLSELIEGLIASKGLKKADVVKRSELAETYAYQIIAGTRLPERSKLLCIAFAMGLTLDETQTLLKTAGYAPLYVKLPFDCIVTYGLIKGLTVIETNEMLFRYGEHTLG